MMHTARRSGMMVSFGLAGWLLLGLATPRAGAQLYGIDVSRYQGTVNWTSVKNAGHRFAFAKATEGSTYTDPYFATNWAGMKNAGLTPGAYHFGRPGTSALTQARFFVNTVKAAQGGLSGGLQLVLDVETTDGQSAATVKAWIKTFVTEVQALTGKPAIIYTNFYFWRDQAGNSTDNYNCPLWIANYNASPLIPAAWTTYTFWQYTDSATVSGVSGGVDRNRFNGTATTLAKFTFP